MNNSKIIKTIIAPLALGIGISAGINASAVAYPDNSTIYSDYYGNPSYNYHRESFRDIQPFRSLNVTPRYHTPSPNDYYYDRDDEYDRHDCNNCRQRRVFRRGIRQPDDRQRTREYYPHSEDRYIQIRIR